MNRITEIFNGVGGATRTTKIFTVGEELTAVIIRNASGAALTFALECEVVYNNSSTFFPVLNQSATAITVASADATTTVRLLPNLPKGMKCRFSVNATAGVGAIKVEVLS